MPSSISLWCRISCIVLLLDVSQCVIIGAAVLPHGDFAYDPSLIDNKNGSLELHKACGAVGDWIMNEMKPDLIFITTPHGLALDTDFLIYQNAQESGYVMLGDDLHNSSAKLTKVTLNITSNGELAKSLTDILRAKNPRNNNNVSGILGFADSNPLPISWGEILPIKYLQNATQNNNESLLPEFVIFSMPSRRYNHSVEMKQELLDKGYDIWNILNDEDVTGSLDIFVIISADLAHTHTANIMPYGNCSCAEPYDVAIGDWISTMNGQYLLDKASHEQSIGAMSCGYTGFVLLQGMFKGSVENHGILKHKDIHDVWRSILLANYHPSYYGMAVGNFTRINIKKYV
eukprot:1111259_1